MRAGSSYCEHLAAAPALFDGAGDGRIDGDRVSPDVGHYAVPLDIEWPPAISRVLLVHAHGVDPSLVADAPHDHGLPGFEVVGVGHADGPRADGHVVVGYSLFGFFERRPTGLPGDLNERRHAAAAGAAARISRADEDRAGVAHSFAAQHHAARLDFQRRGQLVVTHLDEHGAAEAVLIERQGGNFIDGRLEIGGVVVRNRPDCRADGHGRNRLAASAVSGVREIGNHVALFVGNVSEFAILSRIDSGYGRRKIRDLRTGTAAGASAICISFRREKSEFH